MRVRVVLMAGIAVVAATVIVLLLQSDRRPSGSNFVLEAEEVAKLRGRDELCQDAGLVPGDTGALLLRVGTYFDPTPELRVTLRRDGETISTGRLPAGHQQGLVTIPIERVEDTTNDVEVCVESGPGRRIVLYGQGGAVRFQWLREGRESWVATIPTIAHRFGLGKAISGAWLLAFAAALLLAAWVLALRLLTREPRA